MSKWRIVKRKFTALKHKKGSNQRKYLNKSPITSEYARAEKWVVLDGKGNPLKTFATTFEANEFIQNPNKFKLNYKCKTYTGKNYRAGIIYNQSKRNSVKKSLSIL